MDGLSKRGKDTYTKRQFTEREHGERALEEPFPEAFFGHQALESGDAPTLVPWVRVQALHAPTRGHRLHFHGPKRQHGQVFQGRFQRHFAVVPPPVPPQRLARLAGGSGRSSLCSAYFFFVVVSFFVV